MTVDELLNSKQIDFRSSGKDFLIRCLNPEHEDRNPSLRIDKTTGIFNCLSCGYKGNLFEYFQEKANVLHIRRQRLMEAISKKLLETTGYSIPENAVPFEEDWRNISKETFIKFGAFQHNNPEYIGRVVIPVIDITGKIVAFCGRHQGQVDPKYLFHPAESKLPLFPIVKPVKGNIILVEGIMDMLNLHDKGITNAVCAFGVNKVNEEKLNILKIQGVTGVDICFDSDDAGQNAAKRLEDFLQSRDIITRRVNLGSNKDPGEMTALQVIKLREELYGS